MTSSLRYAFCSRTDCGRVRPHNEDALLVDEACGLAVLADGMGGHNGGEVAAGMAVAGVGTQLADWLGQGPAPIRAEAVGRAVTAAVEAANQAIWQTAAAQEAYRGMGTTLVVAVFLDRQLVLAHVGDSRCYRWRQGCLEALTRDHSLLQAQLDAGRITPAQAAASPRRNIVTRAVGAEPAVQVDLRIEAVQAGDCYLLCSDGLTDLLEDAAVARVLAAAPALPQAAAQLVAAANARGGHDNISVLLVRAVARTDGQ